MNSPKVISQTSISFSELNSKNGFPERHVISTSEGEVWNSGRGFEKASRRKSWCPADKPCRFCKDYVLGGTLRQACILRPKNLKKPRRGKKRQTKEDTECTSSPSHSGSSSPSSSISSPPSSSLSDRSPIQNQDEVLPILPPIRETPIEPLEIKKRSFEDLEAETLGHPSKRQEVKSDKEEETSETSNKDIEFDEYIAGETLLMLKKGFEFQPGQCPVF